MLLKLNNKIINTDRIAIVKRQKNGLVFIDFQGSEKGSSDVTLSGDESAKLWAYLRTVATDVMAFEVDEAQYPPE